MIKVTTLHTGTVAIKTKQQAGTDGRSAPGRKIDMPRDQVWSAPLPILCYLIEHPEGNFVVDTGDTWRNSLRGYAPSTVGCLIQDKAEILAICARIAGANPEVAVSLWRRRQPASAGPDRATL
ncbi:MAG: MBL fold metallo-hydrolase [Rhodobacterales bacterium]|nr:MBL fold metallo-hydrolase [Rhodobacterales bacterium]